MSLQITPSILRKHRPIQVGNWKLVSRKDEPVFPGEYWADFYEEPYLIAGGIPPLYPGGLGTVFTETGTRFRPFIFDFHWIKT